MCLCACVCGSVHLSGWLSVSIVPQQRNQGQQHARLGKLKIHWPLSVAEHCRCKHTSLIYLAALSSLWLTHKWNSVSPSEVSSSSQGTLSSFQ